MNSLNTLIGEQIYVQIPGKDSFKGILTDIGKDILVLFDGKRYFYIPIVSIHRIELITNSDEQINEPNGLSFAAEIPELNFHSVLTNAKGRFTEIYVTGNTPFHGYITSINNDYFTFYSHLHKLMYISLNHLKWLTPYNQHFSPYTLKNTSLPEIPSIGVVEKTLEDQLSKMVGNLIIVDGGHDSFNMGLLKKVQDNMVELVVASGDNLFLPLTHIKCVRQV